MGRHWARLRAGTVAVPAGPSLPWIDVLDAYVAREDATHVEVGWAVEGPEDGTLDVALCAAADLQNAVWEKDGADLIGYDSALVVGYPPIVLWYLQFRAAGFLMHQVGPYEA